MKQLKMIPVALAVLMFLVGVAQAKQASSGQALQGIDINQATVEELAQLPYIGVKRAELIVARRSQQPFASVDELKEIKGIGDKTLEKIRPHVRVSSP